MTDTTSPAAAVPTPIPDADLRRQFQAWLDDMDPVRAARMLQMLTTTPSWLGQLRVERVYALTRAHTYDEVAALLGVGFHAINKAVKTHRRQHTSTQTTRPTSADTEPSATKRSQP